jgi:hypothetical protein
MLNVRVYGCHRYLWFFGVLPEDGNLVAETCVGVAEYALLIIIVHWLV